ncbi:MAG: FAD:protein FMN transferase [Comamonas sp.]|nr:FAD:protein FMN transferase [Comamonas sp.]
MPKTFSESRFCTLHGATMGTRWSVTLDAIPQGTELRALEQALAAAVEQVDAQMSPWKPDSALMRLNNSAVGTWVELPAQMLAVLTRSLEIAKLSGGAFDPTVGALVNAWGFGARSDHPQATAIASARQAAQPHGYRHLEIDPQGVRARKHADLQLDLCGIAKGYGVDCMVEILREHGIRHALAALDGELYALGAKNLQGELWPIAIESPDTQRRTCHSVIELQDLALATSGDYRRYWEINGAHLAHTMHPHKAAPLNNAVASVTVLAPTCMDADAWATALLVLGVGEGMALSQRLGIEALWLLRRGEGFKDLVELGLGRFAMQQPAPKPE